MTDILLIPAPLLRWGRLVAYLPYGVLSLQAAAKECGHAVEIFRANDICADSVFEDSDGLAETTADAILSERYSAVGLSVTCGSLHHALGVAAILKERSPELMIWFGGPHASVMPKRLLESYPFVDAVFVGEGEACLQEVLLNSSSGLGPALSSVAGVCTRDSFVPRDVIGDLDELPLISQADDYLAFHDSSKVDGVPGEAYLEVERGCDGCCTFCSTRHFWSGRIRYKSPARMVREMDSLYALTGERRFELVGDNLAAALNPLWALCDCLARERPEYRWLGALGLGKLRSEDLARLWAGGCRGFFVGMESGSQTTLDRLGKRMDLQRSIELVHKAIDQGFRVETSFIVGFPWETRSDIEETCRLHAQLLERGVHYSQVQMLCPISGTDLERSEHHRFSPGRYSMPASEDLPLGPRAKTLMGLCPELFTHLGHLETEKVSLAEVRASAFAAEVIAWENKRRKMDDGELSRPD